MCKCAKFRQNRRWCRPTFDFFGRFDMEWPICTLICNNERPVKSLKVNFKSWHLVKSLRILKEFDEKSRNHEISKYCKKYWHAKIDIGENAHYPFRYHASVHWRFSCVTLKLLPCSFFLSSPIWPIRTAHGLWELYLPIRVDHKKFVHQSGKASVSNVSVLTLGIMYLGYPFGYQTSLYWRFFCSFGYQTSVHWRF